MVQCDERLRLHPSDRRWNRRVCSHQRCRAPGCGTSTKARRSPLRLSRAGARASRRRTISSRRDVGSLTLSRLRLVDATRAARGSAKARKRLATTSLSPSLPQLRLWREIISHSGFLASERLLAIEREGLRSSRRPRWEAEAARTGCRIFSQVIGAGRQSDRPVH
jgi:hypothetical protein